MSVYKRGDTYWYHFVFAERHIQESAKTKSKTVAKEAERKRRRELEEAYNGLTDNRPTRVTPVKDLASAFLAGYKLRNPRSATFAKYALNKIVQYLGTMLAVEVTEQTVQQYQTLRLREEAAPKTINEEVTLLLRMLGDSGDVIRARMKRQKTLKLKVRSRVGKAFSRDDKRKMLAAARTARSPAIYPALMLALNTAMRDKEIRQLQWERVDLSKALLIVGDSKTNAGTGRVVPLNSALLEALVEYAAWYTHRFGTIRPEWYVFAFGKPRPSDPTKPMVTLRTSWTNVRKKAGVSGRWHDNRHTAITELAESPETSDETIRDMVGHVSKQMLKHYSHIRMEAKRRAVEAIATKALIPAKPVLGLIAAAEPPNLSTDATDSATSNR
jgi:integrase